MTATTETLTALARAWLNGDRGAGSVLHDALEEAGWPWVDFGPHQWHLSGPATDLAHVWRATYDRDDEAAGRWHWQLGMPVEYGTEASATEALAAAESALRRALRGE